MISEVSELITQRITESINTKKSLTEVALLAQIEKTAEVVVETLKNGGTIYFAGNGGSFADSQHLAAEFVSRFLFDRNPLPSIALGTNASNMSAIGNDYGYDQVFARELKALGDRKDLFIPISTSGNSRNLIEAIKVADAISMRVVGLVGGGGGLIGALCECIMVPSSSVPRIQESQILIGHILCEIAEKVIFKSNDSSNGVS